MYASTKPRIHPAANSHPFRKIADIIPVKARMPYPVIQLHAVERDTSTGVTKRSNVVRSFPRTFPIVSQIATCHHVLPKRTPINAPMYPVSDGMHVIPSTVFRTQNASVFRSISHKRANSVKAVGISIRIFKPRGVLNMINYTLCLIMCGDAIRHIAKAGFHLSR